MAIRLKRIYDPAARNDGLRVLVDRLWPRGVKKEDAELDHWFRELAPSDDLRKWYGHDPEKWEAFRERYMAELDEKQDREAIETLAEAADGGRVTLLFAAKDEAHNNAVVLKHYLQDRE